MGRDVLALTLVLTACGGTEPPAATTPSPESAPPTMTGEALFASHCGSCHVETGATRARSLLAMRGMGTATIGFAMTNGTMKTEAKELTLTQQLRIAEFIGIPDAPYLPPADAICADPSIDLTPAVSRWGFNDRNTGRIAPGISVVDADNVAGLELAWAFGLPRSSSARSQPVITVDTLFVAAEGSGLFALDRYRGCTKWHRPTPASPRTALTLGTAGDRDVLFFGDVEAHVNAVDVETGELLWRTQTTVGEHSILTGASVQHADRLIVPVSLFEVAVARDPDHECCRTHGAVMSLDAASGDIRWTTHLTEPAAPGGTTTAGVRRWGPSGVGVWSTPAIDSARNVVYIGTAQNASAPATEYSDSVVALDLDTGDIAWHFQAMAGDTYNDACSEFPRGPNCPRRAGPDFDIGASVVLTRRSDGRDVLLVGQKSGDVYALDPDANGRLIWQERVGSGSALGGVHWGLATHDGVVFAPAADPQFPLPGYFPRPGLYALDIDDGDLIWEYRVERGCDTNLREYFEREALYPTCSFFYGFSAAPTVINDLVFAPSLDGRVRAFAVGDGTLMWEVDTARPFETINSVEAHGGSIDVAGVQAVGRMLYVQSGYGLFGELPGNVLVAFRIGTK